MHAALAGGGAAVVPGMLAEGMEAGARAEADAAMSTGLLQRLAKVGGEPADNALRLMEAPGSMLHGGPGGECGGDGKDRQGPGCAQYRANCWG